MEDTPKPKMPDVKLATQDWVLKEMMDTERRIEKAFHQQTTYLGERHSLIEKAFHDQTIYLDGKFNAQNRWIIGVMVTIVAAVLALVVAVLFK